MRTIITFFAVVAGFILTVQLCLMAVFHLHERNEALRAQAEKADREALLAAVAAENVAHAPPTPVRASASTSPPTAEEEAVFRAFFDRFGRALAQGDAETCRALFDYERLGQELESLGAFNNFPGGNTLLNRSVFLNGMRQDAGRAFLDNTLFRWEHSEIRWVRRSADGREVVVIAHHRSQILGNRAYKMRWSLIKRADGWRIFDMEDIATGMRFSRGVSSVLTPEFLRNPGPGALQLKTTALSLREALVGIALHEDVDGADERLKVSRGVTLPPPMAAMREMIEGMILMSRGAPDAALKRFDEANRLQPGIPILNSLRASVAAAVGRYAEALQLVDRYLAEVGPDADALAVRGVALEGLDRIPEAIDSYRQALDDLPDLPEAFDGLRRLLDDRQKGELAERIAKASKPLEIFDRVYWAADKDDDTATKTVLNTWVQRTHPDDQRAIRGQFRSLIDAGNFAAAATVLHNRLTAASTDQLKRLVLNTYLFAMREAKRSLEAYTAVPADQAAAAFHLLADELDEQLADEATGPSAAEGEKLLRELIAAHRKRNPDDAWLWFYEGSLLQRAKKFAEAERTFAAGQRKLPPPPKVETPDPETPKLDWDADRFRSARVECLFELKQGLKAYVEVGPPRDTFQQLAHAYDFAKDVAGLEALLAAHRDKDPADRQLAYWSAEVLHLRGKVAEAASAFRKFAVQADAREPNRWSAIDKCIRGYLHANRPGKARDAVVDIGQEHVPAPLRAAVHLANGRPALAEEILAEQVQKAGGCGFFYYDEDFAKQMQRPEYDKLRKKYPDTRQSKPGGLPG